jgi:drug/metabolite transporter superfamily protein YnfA
MADRLEKENPDEPEVRRMAAEPEPGLVADLWALMRQNKKWWLLPALLVLLLFGLLILLAGTGAAPFVYTLF